jgi:lipid-A-disaccharide synthase
MPLKDQGPSYLISAGEFSGDLLGADLVQAMREVLPKYTPFGITGPGMAQAGVTSIASISELSVMGVSEVLSRLGSLRMLESRVLEWVDRYQPRFAILIDNPGFHLRLAEQLKMRGIKVFQFVAPKLWAWGAGRAPKLRAVYDLVLGILPFEEQFFKDRGINYKYIGSPLKDRVEKVMVTRDHLGFPPGRPIIACLPGSRMSELKLNLPTLVATRDVVARKLPEALFVVPVAPSLSFEDVARILGYPSDVPLTRSEGVFAGETYELSGLHFLRGMSLELMAACDAAVVASGTATLECALLGTPMVVVYTMSSLSYRVAQKVVKLPYVSLVNLMAGRKLVSEYIQEFSVDEIGTEVVELLQPSPKRLEMKRAFEEMREQLEGAAALQAATAIAKYLDGPRVASITVGV